MTIETTACDAKAYNLPTRQPDHLDNEISIYLAGVRLRPSAHLEAGGGTGLRTRAFLDPRAAGRDTQWEHASSSVYDQSDQG